MRMPWKKDSQEQPELTLAIELSDTNNPDYCFLTAREVSDRIKVPVSTLEKWRRYGTEPLPFIRVGRMIRYRLSDVIDFMEERLVAFSPEDDANGRLSESPVLSSESSDGFDFD